MEVKEFETDFCTMFKEGPRKNPNQWKHCCIKHDLAYWVAGSKFDRSRADRELRRCVAETGAKKTAQLMYRAVKLGHLSPIKLGYKWGWAYSKKRKKFEPLSKVEFAEMLYRTLSVSIVDSTTLEEFIRFRFSELE